MAKIELTPDQRAAVENRGGSLLVSAAAGSGKTRVLVDRLFRYIRQEQCAVDDFLIITYTKAAAAELRGKIASELARQVAEHPEDAHLRRQLFRNLVAVIPLEPLSDNGDYRESLPRSCAFSSPIPKPHSVLLCSGLLSAIRDPLCQPGKRTLLLPHLCPCTMYTIGKN